MAEKIIVLKGCEFFGLDGMVGVFLESFLRVLKFFKSSVLLEFGILYMEMEIVNFSSNFNFEANFDQYFGRKPCDSI
jgi:hypothetical protein